MAKRVWHVRMTIEANDPEDTSGDPYYMDHEFPPMVMEWFESALSDRMDHPKIIWAEFTWQDQPTDRHLAPADTGETNIIRGTG